MRALAFALAVLALGWPRPASGDGERPPFPSGSSHHEAEADRLGVFNGTPVTVQMVEGSAELPVVIDTRVPDGCVLVSSGYAETATLGAFGPATVVRVG